MDINNITTQINNPVEKSLDKNRDLNINGSFGDMLAKFTEAANNADYEDKIGNLELLAGDMNNTHQTMIAAEKADLTLRLTIQIRNKIIDAYNEVMRMQI